MRAIRLLILSAVAALLFGVSAVYSQTPNYTTNVTQANLLAGSTPLASARVCLVGVDQYGNPITFSAPSWGLILAGGTFCGLVSNGSIPGGINVPDAFHTNAPAPIKYNVTIQPLNSSGQPNGQQILIPNIAGITGSTYSLDSYAPSGVGYFAPSNTLSAAAGVPATCTAPSLFILTSSNTLYSCVNGAYVTISATLPPTNVTAGTYSIGGMVLAVNASGQITMLGNPFGLSLSCTSGSFEAGVTLANPNVCNLFYSNGTPASASITDGTHSLTLSAPFTSASLAYSYCTVAQGLANFTLAATATSTNAQNASASNNISCSFRTFAGSGTPGATGATAASSTAVLAGATGTLSSPGTLGNQGTYSCTASGQKCYVLMQGSSHTFMSGGFAFPMNAPTAVSFTNQYGVSIPMYLYESTNSLTGTFPLIVASFLFFPFLRRKLRIASLLLVAAPAAAQVPLGGAVYVPSSGGALGSTTVTMTNATCNVLSPGSACTVSANSAAAAPWYRNQLLTGSLTSPQTIVYPLGGDYVIRNTTGQTITAGGATGSTVTIATGTQVEMSSPDGANYFLVGPAGPPGPTGTIGLTSAPATSAANPTSNPSNLSSTTALNPGFCVYQTDCLDFSAGGIPGYTMRMFSLYGFTRAMYSGGVATGQSSITNYLEFLNAANYCLFTDNSGTFSSSHCTVYASPSGSLYNKGLQVILAAAPSTASINAYPSFAPTSPANNPLNGGWTVGNQTGCDFGNATSIAGYSLRCFTPFGYARGFITGNPTDNTMTYGEILKPSGYGLFCTTSFDQSHCPWFVGSNGAAYINGIKVIAPAATLANLAAAPDVGSESSLLLDGNQLIPGLQFGQGSYADFSQGGISGYGFRVSSPYGFSRAFYSGNPTNQSGFGPYLDIGTAAGYCLFPTASCTGASAGPTSGPYYFSPTGLATLTGINTADSTSGSAPATVVRALEMAMTPKTRASFSVPFAGKALTNYGDSITAGVYTAGGSQATYVGVLKTALGLPQSGTGLNNRGVAGDQAGDMANHVFNYENSSVSANIAYTVLIGTNDVVGKGIGAYEATFNQVEQAAIAWLATVSNNRVDAGTGSAANWTNDTTYAAVTGKQATVTGAAISFTLATTGGPIYVWQRLIDGNTGTFSVSVDGTVQAKINCFAPTAIATAAGATQSVGLTRIAGIAAGSHTITYTVTSASGTVSILSTGTVPRHVYYQLPTVAVGGVIPHNSSKLDHSFAATQQYTLDVVQDVVIFQGDGLDVRYVPTATTMQAGLPSLYGDYTFTATETAGSAVLTNVSTPTMFGASQSISGAGIPAGTTVLTPAAVGANVTLSANATASGTVTLAASEPQFDTLHPFDAGHALLGAAFASALLAPPAREVNRDVPPSSSSGCTPGDVWSDSAGFLDICKAYNTVQHLTATTF